MNGKRLNLTLLFFSIFAILLADMPRDYYPDALNGKKERYIKNILHDLLKDHVRIGYGTYGTWKVFRQSDRRPNGTVWDMYSDNVYYFGSGSSSSTKGMNIEHSVPKSWWGETGDYNTYVYDASYDVHHLVPSDGDANMAKSNFPIGEISGSVSFNNGVSKVGVAYNNGSMNVYEPADEYKGDFARMYLYVATCYQDYVWLGQGKTVFANNEYPTLSTYGKDLLLKWHRQDPVSQKELDRNNAVFSFQKNRNPFIDYPELVEYVWGDKTNEEFYFESSITSFLTGDYIIFPVITSGFIDKELTVKGGHVTSEIIFSLSGDNMDCFRLSDSHFSADEVNNGVRLIATYLPQSAGFHQAKLTFSGDGLKSVAVNLRGVCPPAQIERVVPQGINSSYTTSDTSVSLKLNRMISGCTWSGKGVSKSGSDYIFNPKMAGKGTHTISWRSSESNGNIRIIVN